MLPENTRMRLSVAAKLALSIFIVSAFFWFGGAFTRAFVGNEMFVMETLSIRTDLPAAVEQEMFFLLAWSSIAVLAWYTATLIFGTLFLVFSKLRFKEHGWLLMSAILFYFFVPVEVYTALVDIKFIGAVFSGSPLATCRELFVKHLTSLLGAPILAVFCYFTIIILAVWQPLKRAAATPDAAVAEVKP